MRSTRRASWAIATAAALILAGCSGGSTGSNGTDGTGTDGATDAATDTGTDAPPVATDAEIDQVTIAFPGSLANLYIGQEGGILNYNLISTIQEGLVTLDKDGKIVPALAESWTTPDPTTYVFTLRQDAKFQDGNPMTAEDVVFSIQQAADENASPATSWYLLNMASIEQTGDFEVTLKTNTPDATFLVNLSSAGAAVVTEKSFWEAHDGAVGTSDSLIMGTGPYKVTEFVPDSHVTLERVDTGWGGVPKATTIRVNFLADTATRLASAKNGDIDIAFNVPVNATEEWSAIDGMRVEALNDLSYVGLLFDQNVPPFDNADVRRAVAQSIDRAAIVDRLLHGYGEVATAVMTPESLVNAWDGTAARAKLAAVPQFNFDLTAAKALIDGAGAAGTELELTFPNSGPQLGVAAQAIAENLSQIGITLSVKEVPLEEWLATVGDGEHGLSFMWYFSTTGDPAEINGYLIGPGNPNAWESEEAGTLLATANAETDPGKRADTLVQLETLGAENVVNAPLWWGKSVTAFKNTIGMTDYSPYSFYRVWGMDLYAAS
jgi:peptide/nickel transport system substrate-binding protein